MGRPLRGAEGGYGYARQRPPADRPPPSRTKEAMSERRVQCISRMSPGEHRCWLLWRNFLDRYDAADHRSAVQLLSARTVRPSQPGKKGRIRWSVGDRVAVSLWLQPAPGHMIQHTFTNGPATVLTTYESQAKGKPIDTVIVRIPRTFKSRAGTLVAVAADQCLDYADFVPL
jgi:hypothetical protein